MDSKELIERAIRYLQKRSEHELADAVQALHSLQQAEPVNLAQWFCETTFSSIAEMEGAAMAVEAVKSLTSPTLPAGQWVKEGWKVVPIDPTGEMAVAAMNAEDDSIRTLGHSVPFLDLWHAMLEAAPEPTED